jgi:hypothetical protein
VCVLLGAEVPFILRESSAYLDEEGEIILGSGSEEMLKKEGTEPW